MRAICAFPGVVLILALATAGPMVRAAEPITPPASADPPIVRDTPDPPPFAPPRPDAGAPRATPRPNPFRRPDLPAPEDLILHRAGTPDRPNPFRRPDPPAPEALVSLPARPPRRPNPFRRPDPPTPGRSEPEAAFLGQAGPANPFRSPDAPPLLPEGADAAGRRARVGPAPDPGGTRQAPTPPRRRPVGLFRPPDAGTDGRRLQAPPPADIP
jgi:hypothetical protein